MLPRSFHEFHQIRLCAISARIESSANRQLEHLPTYDARARTPALALLENP